MPDLCFEQANPAAVIGIDEAGRGPWAGPVTVAAVWLSPAHYDQIPDGLDDSKKVSAAKRERIFAALIDGPHHYAVASIGVDMIDRLGILQATLHGMREVAADLARHIEQQAGLSVSLGLVDGNISPSLGCPEQLVIKGDSKSYSIAAASIIAKQTRDNIMDELALDYPDYGWERNRGYGTRQHQQALAENGVTPHHRRSFAPVKRLLS